MTIFNINSTSLSYEDTKSRLEQLASANKKAVWIRSDLTTSKSNSFTRFFWNIIGKNFDFIRKHFYGVDLEKSREILKHLKPQIEKDGRLINLYNKALGKFKEIAPNHTKELSNAKELRLVNLHENRVQRFNSRTVETNTALYAQMEREVLSEMMTPKREPIITVPFANFLNQFNQASQTSVGNSSQMSEGEYYLNMIQHIPALAEATVNLKMPAPLQIISDRATAAFRAFTSSPIFFTQPPVNDDEKLVVSSHNARAVRQPSRLTPSNILQIVGGNVNLTDFMNDGLVSLALPLFTSLTQLAYRNVPRSPLRVAEDLTGQTELRRLNQEPSSSRVVNGTSLVSERVAAVSNAVITFLTTDPRLVQALNFVGIGKESSYRKGNSSQ